MSAAITDRRSSAPKRRDNGKGSTDKLKGWKEICPEHKIKELDALFKKCEGDEAKIQAEMDAWWEEDAKGISEDDKWQDVSNKKVPKRPVSQARPGSGSAFRGDRGSVASGRGGLGRGGRGGRGGSSGRGVPQERRGEKVERPTVTEQQERKQESKEDVISGTAPQKSISQTHVAWSQRGSSLAPIPISTVTNDLNNITIPINESSILKPDSALTPFVDLSVTEVQSKVMFTQNVWTTKGTAHLIEAEKSKPLPIAQKPPQRSRPQAKSVSTVVEGKSPTEALLTLEKNLTESLIFTTPLVIESEATENGLSASVNGANVNAVGWKPAQAVPSSVSSGPVAVVSSSPVHKSVQRSVVDVSVVVEAPSTVTEPVLPAPVETFKPKTVLNMGQWEAVEEIDFGFGTFGAENDVAIVDESSLTSLASAGPALQATTVQPVQEQMSVNAASSKSAARPPPGLGLGMPPIPANVVHVHELENKLESVSLAAKKDDSPEKPLDNTIIEKKPVTSQMAVTSQLNMPINQLPDGFMPSFPQGAMSQGFPAAYGMGMYNYNAQSFMGVPTPAGPVLTGGILPQQQKQQNIPVQQGLPTVGSLPQQQTGIYTATAPPASNDTSRNNETSSSGIGMPPGMHGAIPYNPALFYAGQQPFQMGQHHGAGYGYGYGHGQYAGVQGAFGYQHLMGQGGYAQHYEDQPQHIGNINAHHGVTNHQSGYNKNTGGYRGRNAHHSNQYNQYQNQYGGYGGQPYNMAYTDHFNQHGGYGPGGMDPYMQNSGYPAGINNFTNQEDDPQLGSKSKGNSRKFNSNPNMHQYQQGSVGFPDTTGNNTTSSYQGWGGSSL